MIAARDDGSSNRQFHFRLNASNQFEVILNIGASIVVTATSFTATTGNWHLLSAEIFDQVVILRKGTTVLTAVSTAMTGLVSRTTPLTIGIRDTINNPFTGKIAAFALMKKPSRTDIANVLADAAALATTKGLTLS